MYKRQQLHLSQRYSGAPDGRFAPHSEQNLPLLTAPQAHVQPVVALGSGFFLSLIHISRIETLKSFADGKTAIVGLVTSGGFNVLGNDGRCSIIGREIGFENIGVDADIDGSTHGNEASFEFVVEKNPDYIFVMDRDAAIQTDGAQLAQEIMENELVMGTDAYKNGNIVYLAHPAVWYTAEGGITALDIMLQDLESKLLG